MVDYNAHLKLVHGVESGTKEESAAQALDRSLSNLNNGDCAFQEGTLTALKTLTMASSQYLPLNTLNMRQSEKEVEEGWDELMVNIEEFGVSKPGETMS